MASAKGSGSWWAASVGAVLPAAGLAAAGGTVGLDGGAGIALAGAAAAWLAVDLGLLQPRVDRAFLGGESLAGAARTFLQRALVARSASDVAVELDTVARRALGVDRTLLIVPSPDGGVQVLGGTGGDGAAVGDAEQAFLWLGDRGEPVDRDQLRDLAGFEGAAAADALLARLGAHVLLPLRHRGLLLGVAALTAPRRLPPDGATGLARFYRSLAAHATVAIANTYLDAEASGRQRLARAFDLATAIQEALMPEDRAVRRSGVSLRGIFRPVAECGGDVWTYAELSPHQLLLLVGDATGHGAAPAMLTAVAKGGVDAMRHVAGEALDPAQLLAALNRAVYRAGRTRYLLTAFAAIVDSRAMEIRFANAGQNFPYVVTRGADGRPRIEALVARGNTLGAAPDAPYQTHVRRFGPGERLVLYTDGLVDAGSPFAEPFGEKRFRAVLAGLADAPAARLPEAILTEVDAYLAGRPFADDITLVAAEVLPPEEGGR